MIERLQKIISRAGITSRRQAEELIKTGRVAVNGKIITKLGTKGDTRKDVIRIDGRTINVNQPLTYLILNKPKGYITSLKDPEGRPTVLDLLKRVNIRVYPVGRLDFETEGLLILTNDGDLANGLMHPRNEVRKVYLAKIKGVITDKEIKRIERGIMIETGKTAPCRIKKRSIALKNSWIEITIHEGKNREIRRMMETIGHPVLKLNRVRYGLLTLGDMRIGEYRFLKPDEVMMLKRDSGLLI
ncbi:MAG: pseudouridine synthase [Nitrospirota bacterium]